LLALFSRNTLFGEKVRTRRRGREGLVLVLVPAALLLAGCGRKQNALAPESHQSRDIASLFWWMMGGAWIGLAVVVGLLLLSWKRRNRRGVGADTEGPKPGERAGWYVVVGAGIVLPIVLLSTLFAISDLFVIRTTQAPAASATKRTIVVIGHQWWWEVRYPGTAAVTANEIHVPVRTPVRVEVRTADVIHSFWVPQLNRKIDAIPGRHNAIELYADAVGRYRGECAEFCGLQHAHMGLFVFADPPGKFRRWLADQSRPAAAPAGGLAGQGRATFLKGPCSSCHTIRGTSADATVGPDLTHVASRTTLAALTLPNGRSSLHDWVRDPQHFKPGSDMPSLQLSDSQLDGLVAYLKGLR
jgi:cytochrome c oxidase subunit II